MEAPRCNCLMHFMAVVSSCLFSPALAITSKGWVSEDYFVPDFVAPQLTPPQYLIISSPKLGKIVYTPLRNFKSQTGRTYALIDSGLAEPRGIALDRERGALYVADPGAGRIYRYRLIVTDPGNPRKMQLATDGVQVTIAEGVQANWVAADISGDVFYSDPISKTVNRIPAMTISMLCDGEGLANDLQFVSEKQLEAASLVEAEQELSDENLQPPSTSGSMKIYTVYEGKVNPRVSVPAGLASDGLHLYWANGVNAKSAGSVVRGMVKPKQVQRTGKGGGAPMFPAMLLANNTDAAYGVAKSSNMVLYSSNQSGVGSVYGIMDGTKHVTRFVSTLAQPRGMVWDGDQTVYVADQAAHAVWSFPVGRVVNSAPITRSVALHGAFGVALLSQLDPGYLAAVEAGAMGLHGGVALRPILLALLAAATFCSLFRHEHSM
eukprot:CAMPEP_0172673456 /NCGR_PEP_ID=MMETSP1074-20121228/12156_1 /TAXON_ID=2916 /ORGANISM="Ceratium fusus, Strain PA161109" /LENGTH=434 /DNA_ID=CAMNT_0013490757 /DNA_START=148 /DNA_END=1452 /DNA_ORIENTATION=-